MRGRLAGAGLVPASVLAPCDDAAQRLAGTASTSQQSMSEQQQQQSKAVAEAEEDEEAAPRSDSEALTSAKLLLSGGVAGAVSKSATAPLARLTILYQVGAWPMLTAACCLRAATRNMLQSRHTGFVAHSIVFTSFLLFNSSTSACKQH